MNPFINLEEDFFSIDSLLFLAGASGSKLVEDTAIGNPVTFTTNVARPLKSCLATWQPHQSGSGDPSPENVRPITGMDGVTVWHTGKNLFDGEMELGGIDASTGQNTETSDRIRSKNYIPIPTAYKLFLYCGHETSYLRVFYYREDKTFISTSAWGSGNREFVTNDASYIRIVEAYSTQYNNDIAINYPSTETAYTPYSGESFPIIFPALGKNLLNPANRIASGNNVQYYRTGDRLLLKGGQTYTISTNITPSQISIFKGTNTPVASTTSATLTYTPTEDVEVWIDIYVTNARLPEGGISDVYGMLELGDTAHSYEPYTRTVYGGSLDLTTGVLTAEYGIRQLTGYETGITWSVYANRDIYTTSVIFPGIYKDGSSPNIYGYCNVVKTFASGKIYSEWIATENSGLDGKGVTFNSVINNWGLESATAEALTEMLKEMHDNGNTLTVVYKLATPKTFQLTPQQITALLGNNTMWADSDDLSVTYLKKG